MSEITAPELPTHIETDWNYFLKHVEGKRVDIPSFFDKENWKINEVYRMRVSHIYDPSHFWIVTKEGELDAFQKYLNDFYTKYSHHYKIPKENIRLNMYCVCFTDGACYRAILVKIFLPVEGNSWAHVFLIDFGYMSKVTLDEIYFMTKKMYTVPQLAVRACLSGLGPISCTIWSNKATDRFHELVSNKLILGRVTNRYYAKKTLYLDLGEYNWETRSIDSINHQLVMERLCKLMTIVDVKDMKQAEKLKGAKRSKNIRLPFLAPTFRQIDMADCLDTLAAAKCMEQFQGK